MGEAASVDNGVFCISSTYTDKDIYNADEMGLFFQLLPVKTLAVKADRCIVGKSNQNHIMLLLCSNMDGTDKRELFVIGKTENP